MVQKQITAFLERKKPAIFRCCWDNTRHETCYNEKELVPLA
ncbi:hypothetical protein GEOBRER4_n1406 [Citrifermentans bremense]|uniref:Uncharacterized protein n=1 Tax=Citrifermentans bremense TaxID=60035 RepID=A0A7R7FS41_9BACT|nr:hypothetical protein GEOBRER4_n1406 [Citrifermentans bremense]